MYLGQPLPNNLGGKLWAIIRTNVLRSPVMAKQFGQVSDHIIRPQRPSDSNRQTFPALLIDHRQEAQGTTIVSPCGNEVIGPDMIPVLGSQAQTRAVIQPESPALGLLLWNL